MTSSSSGLASMNGRNTGTIEMSGFGAAPVAQANSSAYGGRIACQSSSTSSSATPKACANAVFASRADTPIRSAPVASFSSANRPSSSSLSSSPASTAFAVSRDADASSATASLTPGAPRTGPVGAGHIRLTVSAVSPTKSRDSANSTGSTRSWISARTIPALIAGKSISPVSPASAHPRSGSGTSRR